MEIKGKTGCKRRELKGRMSAVLPCLVLPLRHISPCSPSAFGQLAVTGDKSTELAARTVTDRIWEGHTLPGPGGLQRFLVELLLWKDPQSFSHPPPGLNQRKLRWFLWVPPCHRTISSLVLLGGDFDECWRNCHSSRTYNSQRQWNLPKLIFQTAGNDNAFRWQMYLSFFCFKRINNVNKTVVWALHWSWQNCLAPGWREYGILAPGWMEGIWDPCSRMDGWNMESWLQDGGNMGSWLLDRGIWDPGSWIEGIWDPGSRMDGGNMRSPHLLPNNLNTPGNFSLMHWQTVEQREFVIMLQIPIPSSIKNCQIVLI